MRETSIPEKIIEILNPMSFHKEVEKIHNDHFPDSLKLKLDYFYDFYCKNLYETVDIDIDWDGGPNDWVKNRLKRLSDSLVEIVKLYYKGELVEAGIKFFQLMDEDFKNVKLTKIIPDKSVFYRARNYQGKEYSALDLFHIGFEFRHLISSSRYSAPGLPCLYLGDSTFVCWEELNRSSFSNLWYSKYENFGELKILDLIRPDELEALFHKEVRTKENELSQVLKYISTYPIYIASTIKVERREANFKPEYIIPQLLIQYVTNRDEIDGIRFPSSKVEYSDLNEIKASNYAFPVRTIGAEGFCIELKSKFRVSDPTSYEIVSLLDSGQSIMYSRIESGNSKLRLGKSENSYFYTAFGKLERVLGQRECNILD